MATSSLPVLPIGGSSPVNDRLRDRLLHCCSQLTELVAVRIGKYNPVDVGALPRSTLRARVQQSLQFICRTTPVGA